MLSPSTSLSSASQVRSPSMSAGVSDPFIGSLVEAYVPTLQLVDSSSSEYPSESSSVSALSPIPSPSKSTVSSGFAGNTSVRSPTPSPSQSVLAAQCMPSATPSSSRSSADPSVSL